MSKEELVWKVEVEDMELFGSDLRAEKNGLPREVMIRKSEQRGAEMLNITLGMCPAWSSFGTKSNHLREFWVLGE